jgi:glycosyltransferase involved in cell wall biosynthesis
MPNAREVLAAFDIFILPSTQPDPFPTVILEAMSAGIPVIATAHGGPLEMVVDGETGLLVPPGDPAALAAAIELLLLDAPKRKAMGDAGRRRIENEFALDTSLNRVQQVYSATLCNQA